MPHLPASVWRLAIRMTLAAVFAYIVTDMVGLHQGYWAVITCLVVMQGSLGATINAGLARVAGTAAGAAAGGLGALLKVLVPEIPHSVILLLVIAPMALLAASKAIFRLAPLTSALVLLLAGTSSTAFALSRIAEIALGTVIGVGFSWLVLPERATALLVQRVASLLELLAAYSDLLLCEPHSPAHERMALRIRSGFALLQNDMKEVEHERTAHLLRSDPFPEDIARHAQRLRTDISMLGRAVEAANTHAAQAALAGRVGGLFRAYAAALRGTAPPPEADVALDAAAAPDTPIGFALTTLQAEFRALDETLKQRSGAQG